MEENKVYQESIAGLIGTIARDSKSKKEHIKKWGLKQVKPLEYSNNNVSDKDFEEFEECIKKMQTVESYSSYKKYYDKLSKKMGINPSKYIQYKLTKGEKDKNSVYFKYFNVNKKVNIPNGCGLYHISPCPTRKELKPTFRGKPPRCYFYSTPRVYCTIKENMGKGYAQFKGSQKNVQTTKYKVIENIQSATLDDRIGNVFSGAVYIETRFPIKVKKVSEILKEEENK